MQHSLNLLSERSSEWNIHEHTMGSSLLESVPVVPYTFVQEMCCIAMRLRRQQLRYPLSREEYWVLLGEYLVWEAGWERSRWRAERGESPATEGQSPWEAHVIQVWVAASPPLGEFVCRWQEGSLRWDER